MLVSLGAALFMVASILLVHEFENGPAVSRVDPTRIASTIVTGVGFLGGGIIFRNEGGVRGLTTAAGLWVAAAIGMAVGAGFYITAAGGGMLTLVILTLLRRVEHKMAVLSGRGKRNLPSED
jgi:putative Mg2+ transporter-C (MgtC) family protein